MWEKELEQDFDKAYILHGLKYGFPIVDCPLNNISPAFTANHRSAISETNLLRVEQRIKEELMEGNYVKVENPPLITSALAAIDKPDGDIRLIHDLSRQFNGSVNDFATKDACEYETLSDAITLLTPSSYMAKVDLKSAYRSVEIRHEHQTLTGLQWTFLGDSRPTTLLDKCLPFGAPKSPAAFNRIT